MNKKIKKQLKLLKEQGFVIEDSDLEKITGYMEKVGYNRLFHYFNVSGGNIDRVIQLYIFDKKLRLLMLDMLEVVENSLKTILIYHVGGSMRGNFRYINYKSYKKETVSCRLAFIWGKIDYLSKRDARAKVYIENSKNNNETRIPDYIFFDKLTFGEVVKLISDLDDDYQKIISGYFGISKKIFFGRLNNLKYFRNLCSHYENIFNRNMTYSIKSKIMQDTIGTTNNFVSYFALLSLFNAILIPQFKWSEKVIDLMSQYGISFEDIGQKENLPSEHETEAWEVLVGSLYTKYVKKSS